MSYAVYFNSEAKKEKFLWFTIHTSGHGYWIPVWWGFGSHEEAERHCASRGLDMNKYKIVRV